MQRRDQKCSRASEIESGISSSSFLSLSLFLFYLSFLRFFFFRTIRRVHRVPDCVLRDIISNVANVTRVLGRDSPVSSHPFPRASQYLTPAPVIARFSALRAARRFSIRLKFQPRETSGRCARCCYVTHLGPKLCVSAYRSHIRDLSIGSLDDNILNTLVT